MTQTKEIKASNNLRFSASKTIGKETIYVEIRLNDECKNGHQDFAITGSLYEAGQPKIDRYFISGGCIHDDIIKFFPEFKQFVDLHLCDYKGIPMHAGANGLYHLRQGFNNTKPEDKDFEFEFCEYYRLTTAQFDELNKCHNQIQYTLALQNLGILNQWEIEANKAIAKLEELTGTKFIVDSKRTQYVAATSEEIAEEDKRQREGYYTPDGIARREAEKIDKQILRLQSERDATIDKAISTANKKYQTLQQILIIGGSASLNNCLWYDHSNTVAFNWRGYDMISDEIVNRIISSIELPEGVIITNDRNKK